MQVTTTPTIIAKKTIAGYGTDKPTQAISSDSLHALRHELHAEQKDTQTSNEFANKMY